MSSIKTYSPPFRPGTTLTSIRVNIVMDQGGLGDMIARLPAINYLLKSNVHLLVRLWCPEYFIELAQAIYSGMHARIEVLSISDYSTKCAWDEPHFSFKDSQHTSLATNLTRHAFNLLVNQEVPEDCLVYPKLKCIDYEADSPAYIVLAPNSTAPARKMPQELFDGIIAWTKKQGLAVKLLGRTTMTVRSSKHASTQRVIESETLKLAKIGTEHVEDLRDQTSLLEAHAIIEHSAGIIGFDSGLIHLAGLTSAPIISIFTSVDPDHRKILRLNDKGLADPHYRYRAIWPPENIVCRFCQSQMGFVYGHRFRYCYYDDYLCCKSITLADIELAYKNLQKELVQT